MSGDPDDPEDRDSFIPADHLAAIGRIANAWASLEFSVDKATWRLAEVTDMVGACLTSQFPSFHVKMRALIALAELRGASSATISGLRSFQSKDAAPLQSRRNRAVHDARLVHQASGEVNRLQITADSSLIFDFHPEPLNELHNTRKKIEALVFRFFTLRDALFVEVDSLPEKSGRPLHEITSLGREG